MNFNRFSFPAWYDGLSGKAKQGHHSKRERTFHEFQSIFVSRLVWCHDCHLGRLKVASGGPGTATIASGKGNFVNFNRFSFPAWYGGPSEGSKVALGGDTATTASGKGHFMNFHRSSFPALYGGISGGSKVALGGPHKATTASGKGHFMNFSRFSLPPGRRRKYLPLISAFHELYRFLFRSRPSSPEFRPVLSWPQKSENSHPNPGAVVTSKTLLFAP